MGGSKNSHNLGVISRNSIHDGQERRKLARLSLGSEQFKLAVENRIFSVTDLSEKGMGLWFSEREDIRFFTVGLLFEGLLNLKREKYRVQARVRNLNQDRVGCEFIDLPPGVSGAISQYLDPTLLGAELKPIPSSEMNLLWYHGPSETDLLLRRASDGQYSEMDLYVLHSFIKWEQEHGLSTGSIHTSQAPSEVRGIFRFETLFLEEDSVPDPHKLSIAKTVILSSNLSKDLKSWCVRHFER